ncbi:MAG: primase-helicase zinc-binding domain-containing protein [Syntrophaceae bacterium]
MNSLFDLFQADGHVLKKVSNTHGGEYAGPCPDCGGNDRFRVWSEQKGGRYWCRQCGKSGDAIQYLKDFRNMTYSQACQYLGKIPKPRRCSAMPCRQSKATFTPREMTAPGSTWTEKAQAFLEQCQHLLWSDKGKDTRDFLHNQKGLSDDTIRSASLGLNSSDVYLDRETWGLAQEKKVNGQNKKLWLPAGLLIPFFVNDSLVRMKIRRSDPGNGDRYIFVSGSSSQSMIWNLDNKIIVIVESELDGMLVYQDAGDLVGVVALGSAQAKPDATAHDAFSNANKILVALDTDDAGAKAAWNFWFETYANKVQRWPCIRGKDPSEAWQQGLDIRAWVMAGLLTEPSNAEQKSAVVSHSINIVGNRKIDQVKEEPAPIKETVATCILSSTDKIVEEKAMPTMGKDELQSIYLPFPVEWNKFDETTLERLAIMTIDGGLSDSEVLNLMEVK